MKFGQGLRASVAVGMTAVLAACGGGGGSPGDTRPNTTFPVTTVTGPDSFLLFPNPQVMADGTKQTNTATFTNAYYAAIDPNNQKDTLNKWKAANGWDTGTGQQITVVFGDQRDLGYGRRMNVRRNPDGTISFFVENYLVRTGSDYAYSGFNLDAAVVRDTSHFIGVNAIEFSPGPNGGPSFAKFFNFSSTTGERAVMVDLDGRGGKAMPGPCISCHGGRGDALTPAGSDGKQLFNLVRNSESQTRGDVEAHLHPFEPDVFGFSTAAGFTRVDQEASIKTINTWILCSYPLPAPSTAPEDACRRPASRSEWQGTAAALIKAAYGGDGLPNATFVDDYVPPGWLSAGQSTLYNEVIKPSCRTCHIMRGNGGNSDLDFNSYEKFQAYSDRVKAHIVDRGNMPLAKIVYDAFNRGRGPDLVATFLQGQGQTARDTSGVALKPGRPIADAGPDRVVRQGATTLSAAGSLYADSYAWSLVSGPSGGASLSATSGASITFNATANGTYVVQLVASAGSTQSTAARINIVVDSALSPAPSAVRFSDIKTMLQTSTCTNCHSPTGSLPRPPLFYTNEDRNGDGTVGDATDDAWYYAEVRSRVNFTDMVASPLLRKPSGNHHGGNFVQGFDTTVAPGNPARAKYDLVLNWILNGAPQ
jgi:mono/diheme cytochrome c family protein